MSYVYNTPNGRSVSAGCLGDAQVLLVEQLQPLLQGGAISDQEYSDEIKGLARDEASTRSALDEAQSLLAAHAARIAELEAALAAKVAAAEREAQHDVSRGRAAPAPADPLTQIEGVTAAMAKQLRAAALTTAEEVGGTALSRIQSAIPGLSQPDAAKIIQAARKAAGG